MTDALQLIGLSRGAIFARVAAMSDDERRALGESFAAAETSDEILAAEEHAMDAAIYCDDRSDLRSEAEELRAASASAVTDKQRKSIN